MLGCVYAYLLLEVGLRDLDKSFHISYLYIENFWIHLDIPNLEEKKDQQKNMKFKEFW